VSEIQNGSDMYYGIMTNPQSRDAEEQRDVLVRAHLTCGGSCGSSPCNGTDPFTNPCRDG
jgi:hypothetical protein